ncbi:MAG TPA: putative zinc-binding metallopeptidase, partial [Microlunatus sp.]
GIISLDLAESLDDHREALRVRLGEPYRTMLGHLRHEVGHYYQNVLLIDDQAWRQCRDLFGDERASYRDAITRHYSTGAPQHWQSSFISEYATMHPWEDFAETFAHYLHITGTLQTASAIGIHLDARQPMVATPTSIPSGPIVTSPSRGSSTTGTGCRRRSTGSTARWASATCTPSSCQPPYEPSSGSCTTS